MSRTSRMASASTPPKPASNTGPHSGSLRAPKISSTPFGRHALHEDSFKLQVRSVCFDVSLEREPAFSQGVLVLDVQDHSADIAFVRQVERLVLSTRRESRCCLRFGLHHPGFLPIRLSERESLFSSEALWLDVRKESLARSVARILEECRPRAESSCRPSQVTRAKCA